MWNQATDGGATLSFRASGYLPLLSVASSRRETPPNCGSYGRSTSESLAAGTRTDTVRLSRRRTVRCYYSEQ